MSAPAGSHHPRRCEPIRCITSQASGARLDTLPECASDMSYRIRTSRSASSPRSTNGGGSQRASMSRRRATQPAVRLHGGHSEAVMMRWGLIPSWAKGDLSAGHWLRLSCGDLERSRLFRGPWLNSQRCILPFAGFYTWRLTGAGYRQPYFVRAEGRPVFAVAASMGPH